MLTIVQYIWLDGHDRCADQSGCNCPKYIADEVNGLNRIRIGWSSEFITPDKPVLLAGQFYERVADQVRDPIMATAMAVESADGHEQLVWVSCDLLHTVPHILDEVRAAVRRTMHDLDPERIVINATHIHTGPFMGEFGIKPHFGYRFDHSHVMKYEDYCRFAVERIVKAVAECWRTRTSGSIGFGESDAVLSHNRMVRYGNGTGAMYGRVDTPDFVGFGGPEDHRVDAMFTWDEHGELSGIVLNAACTAQFMEHQSCITADLYGEVRKLIRHRYGELVHVLSLVGAAGDLSPLDLLRSKDRKNVDREAKMKQAARRLLAAIEEALDTAQHNVSLEPAFIHKVKPIELPLRPVSKSDGEAAAAKWRSFQAEMDDAPDPTAYFQSLGMTRQVEAYEWWAIQNRHRQLQQAAYYTMELHAIRLENTALVTNPFELYTEYGLMIKGRSAAQRTYIAQLACGHGGYLPTAAAIAAGGYSTYVFSGLVGEEGGRMLVEHTVAEIEALWKG